MVDEEKTKETEEVVEPEKTEDAEKTEDKTESEKKNAEKDEPEKDSQEDIAKKLKDSEDKYLRLYAEFDNYKKRTQKEKDARYADAVIDTAAEFLPVLDNLERALAVEVTSEDAKNLKAGVEMVHKQMIESLSKMKISAIAAVGEEFDPNLHNAVMHVDDESVTDNTVVEEFMKGYIYNDDRVVRHSMVKVAN
ncbi:MAG: nucleotide exchange factor GrpE [Clostridiales bacterium]|nr:nucleotide exchange factor GrpE [Clostridiales bacterium]